MQNAFCAYMMILNPTFIFMKMFSSSKSCGPQTRWLDSLLNISLCMFMLLDGYWSLHGLPFCKFCFLEEWVDWCMFGIVGSILGAYMKWIENRICVRSLLIWNLKGCDSFSWTRLIIWLHAPKSMNLYRVLGIALSFYTFFFSNFKEIMESEHCLVFWNQNDWIWKFSSLLEQTDLS